MYLFLLCLGFVAGSVFTLVLDAAVEDYHIRKRRKEEALRARIITEYLASRP